MLFYYKNDVVLDFPDRTFKSHDYISKKSVAQLVFSVMDYKSGTAFSWDTVKRFIFDKGFVTDFVYSMNNDASLNV